MSWNQVPETLHNFILEILTEKKFEAYIVGGAVRNELLGLPVKDYDICTSATPGQIKSIFEVMLGITVDLVGAHFGVTLIKNGYQAIEVATFRTDGSYSDGRHPDSVEYTTSITEDLSRRDFTINTLLKTHDGRIRELIPGTYEDLFWFKQVDCVGDANKRFVEDPLRILRACRFTAQLNFSISAITMEAMEKNAFRIVNLSKERIAQEFNRMLSFKYRDIGWHYLYELKILEHIHPDLVVDIKIHHRIMLALSKIKPYQTIPIILSTIFYCKGLRFDQITYLKDYKYSNDDIKQIQSYMYTLQLLSYVKDMSVARFKRYIREKDNYDAMFISEICRFEEDKENRDYVVNADYSNLCPRPNYTGQDLINWGFEPGPKFTAILYDIESGQLEGWLKTEEQAKAIAEKLYGKSNSE